METSNTNRLIKEEKSQAVLRVAFTVFIAVSVFLFYLNVGMSITITFIALGMFASSLVILAIVHTFPGNYPIRRTFLAILDSSATGVCIYLGGPPGAIYSFVFLWITVGNGIRFGSRALIESLIITVSIFSIIVNYSDVWKENIYFTVSIYIMLTMIPLYVLSLTNKLSDLSLKLQKQLSYAKHAATHDPLSGLCNRASFYKALDTKISENTLGNTFLMVMYIDLDGFKLINDQLGHKYGDVVIQKISERLKEITREGDTVCRLGGDEFALILSGTSDNFDAKVFCTSIINKISEPMKVEGSLLHVTASIGLSRFPDNGIDSEQLTDSADKAMYYSKSSGKNRFHFSFN